ncbi:MAG: ankyrin repeat domain-containing protein [Candidatus Moranbacteria bacterium]|nr:ankyrin repeat domain-containing protein [Candidatus Moranbacteria bacterium]
MKISKNRIVIVILTVILLVFIIYILIPVSEDKNLESEHVNKKSFNLENLSEEDEKFLRESLGNPKNIEDRLDPVCKRHEMCKPISMASFKGNIKMVNLLLDVGVDIDGKTGESGDTPLIFAIMQENRELVELLISRGANVNEKNFFNMSAFGGVCGMGNEEYVRLFLENGADVNQILSRKFSEDDEPSQDVTPLIFATRENNLNVVKLLIEAGADKSLKDSNDKTALDYAEKQNNSELMEILK